MSYSDMLYANAIALFLSIPALTLCAWIASAVYNAVRENRKNADAQKRHRECEERLLRKAFKQLLQHIWVYSEYASNYLHTSEFLQRHYDYHDPLRAEFVEHTRLTAIQIHGLFAIMETLHLGALRDTTSNLINKTWDLTNELSQLQDPQYHRPFKKPESDLWLTLRDLHHRVGYSVFLRLQPWKHIEGETALRAKIWLEMLPRIFDSIINEKSDLAAAELRIAKLKCKLERIFTESMAARRYHYGDDLSWREAHSLAHNIYNYQPTLADQMERLRHSTEHSFDYEQPVEKIINYDSMAELRPRLLEQRRQAALKATIGDKSIW